MQITSFVAGFAAAIICMVCIMTAVHVHLNRTRRRKTNIKGYLDLIPDLSQQQRARVQDIRRVFLPKVEEIRRSMRSMRAELAELLFEEPVDRKRVYETVDRIIQSQSELEKEVIEHILEEKDLLSPSQNRMFYEIIVGEFSSGGLGVHDTKRG
jgi:hypothetical protein